MGLKGPQLDYKLYEYYDFRIIAYRSLIAHSVALHEILELENVSLTKRPCTESTYAHITILLMLFRGTIKCLTNL
jgi:hypothetical protein